VLPVFNGEKYLRLAIESVLSQSLREFELIIGDDGSTDRSRAIARSFVDDRIRFVDSSRTRGLFANLNQLLSLAKAPLVHILCQDDIMEAMCLERDVEFFAAHGNVSMVFSKATIIDATDKAIDAWALNDLPAVIPPLLSVELLLYSGCIPGNLSTVCLRTQIWREYHGFDESFSVSGDYEFWSRVSQEGGIGVIHERTVRVRRHSGQLSSALRSGPLFIAEDQKIRASLLQRLPTGARGRALRYSMLRNDVIDTHFGLRCLVGRRLRAFSEVLSVMGIRRFSRGLAFWFITLNNRLYLPKRPFTAS
jgi:glycosyltransferase involved in cell wall biosynthesis